MGAVIIVIALVLKATLFDLAEIGHNGMAPTLIRGDRVLIYKRGEPALGSIAVCQHPDELGWVVARVAATGGMTIGSFGNDLRLDGAPLGFEPRGAAEFHNLDTDRTRSLTWGSEVLGSATHLVFVDQQKRYRVDKTEVPAGKLYLLGDFRSYMGQDSRAYGLVDESTCRGTIVFRLLAADGLGPAVPRGSFAPIE